MREFARAKSFTQRGTFSHIARHLIAAFSSRFVKDWVFDLCLELLYDPVPNVRLQVRISQWSAGERLTRD